MLDQLTQESFAKYLNHRFQLVLPNEPSVEWELVDLRSTEFRSPETGGREPFSLVFRAPAETCLPQAIYRLEHDDMGVLEMFLVPIGPDQEGMLYEAVFN